MNEHTLGDVENALDRRGLKHKNKGRYIIAQCPSVWYHMYMKCKLCTKEAMVKGLCPMHYTRMKRHGDPTITLKKMQRHGLRWTPEYKAWDSMVQRCTNKNNNNYHHYGGRGITICERWRDPVLFVSDMGTRPKGATLDRIDNDGNYEPGNCRWATREQQSHNRRFNGKSAYRNIRKRDNRYEVSVGRKYGGRFVTIEEALWARDRIEEELYG